MSRDDRVGREWPRRRLSDRREAVALSDPAAEASRPLFGLRRPSERVEIADLDLPTVETSAGRLARRREVPPRRPGVPLDLFLDLAGVDNAQRRGRPDPLRGGLSPPVGVARRARPRQGDPAGRRSRRACRRCTSCGPRRTGSSARRSTCSASTSPGHPNLRRLLCHDAFVGQPAAQGLRPGPAVVASRRRTSGCRTGRRIRRSAPGTSRPRRSRSAPRTPRPTASFT